MVSEIDHSAWAASYGRRRFLRYSGLKLFMTLKVKKAAWIELGNKLVTIVAGKRAV